MKTFVKENLEWMAENLAVTVDREGNELVLGKDYWYPNGDEKNVEKYGLLYTWHAATRACPKGWRLPTIDEISEDLIKSNEFSALPAGYYYGSFYSAGNSAYFWSSTPNGSSYAYFRLFGYYYQYVGRDTNLRYYGFSVRCVKDIEKNEITEMNAEPSPKWVKDFQAYLIERLDIDRITAIEVIGNLCKIRRENKETIDKNKLDELATEYSDKDIERFKKDEIWSANADEIVCSAREEGTYMAFMAGYRKAKEE